MGLMNKLKNILFEEEEVEIPVIEKKEKKPAKVEQQPVYKEMPKKEVETVKKPTQTQANYSDFYEPREPVVERSERPKQPVVSESRYQKEEASTVSERELFRSEKTFNFPAFDEDEFRSSVPKSRVTNVMEHEKKKEAKKAPEYSRKVEKKEEEVAPKTKFKPSPIISPVYGILDKNYTPDEITSRIEVVGSKALDVDSVRRKAFGDKTEEVKSSDDKYLDDKILEEKLEKARTIDELLKDSSDDIIELREDKKTVSHKEDIEEVNKSRSNQHIDSFSNIKHDDADTPEDTLESDLFDLIDSMYENREDGE